MARAADREAMPSFESALSSETCPVWRISVRRRKRELEVYVTLSAVNQLCHNLLSFRRFFATPR